jgi:hypothetical protein
MKTKIVRLKNLYTGEIVFTNNYNEVVDKDGIEFIYVYKEDNPNRKYLVNRKAFEVLNK